MELTEILEELEWNHGYGPSFHITEDSNISDCKQNIYKDFETYKMELVTSEVLVESKNDIIRRLDAI
jgi:hypothetical protein